MSRQGNMPGKTPVKSPARTLQSGSQLAGVKTGSCLMTRSSRGPGTAATDDAPVQRAAYVAPEGYDTAGLMSIITDYLTRTELEKRFKELLHLLLDRPQLPYNPYPGFATRLRPYAERFIMFMEADHHIDTLTTQPLQESRLLNLFTLKDCDGVWGLKSVMRVINLQSVLKYKWLIADLTPKNEQLFLVDGYSNQVMVALVGGAVFHGTFYSQCHIVQLRIEYLVTGPEIAQGVAIFINSVMLDIDFLVHSNTHILLGVNVPVEVSADVWEQEFWDPQDIEQDKVTLLENMTTAIAASKYINAECIFKTDPLMKSYVRGQKQYSFNFITVIENNLREEGLLSFAEFPMGSLHEGVFLNQTQAEAYINIFSPQTNFADVQNIRKASARPNRPESHSLQDGRRARPSMLYDDDRTLVHRHVNARLEMLKPTKIRIDGFRIGEDTGFGPFAWQITSPIKSHLQQRIAGFHPQGQIFDIVYNTLLVVLMDRPSFDSELLHELYRLCHSTAGRLHLLNEQNKSLRALIRGFAEKDEMLLIRSLLAEYRNGLDELLAHSIQERSTELKMVGRVMVAVVDQLLAPEDRDFSSATHVEHIVSTMRNIQHFSIPLLLQLSEDAVDWCPQLKDLITKFHQIFPESVLIPQTRVKQDIKPGSVGGKLSQGEKLFKHGFEEDRINSHEHSVIDVELCKQKDTAPKLITTESVLLKYVTDTHLDEVWHRFLVSILAEIQLLPNPYPRFLSLMRQCATKMDLFYVKDSVLQERLTATLPQLVDAENYIYQLPACQAFGPLTALSMVDTGAFVSLHQKVEELLVNKSYIHRKGPYRVGICFGMVSPTTLYGKLMPYLHCLELHEHYYIQGPIGCEADAQQLFGRMVQAHVAELIEMGRFPIVGVVMGLEKVRWSWKDLINKRHNFWLELEMTCSRKEPIFMKAYIEVDGWRYQMVKKHFMLHYITDDSMENSRCYPHNPAQYYETLFFTSERAAFHYQNDGVPRGGNPCSGPNCRAVSLYLDEEIVNARHRAHWFLVHRYILLKALITQEGVGKAAAECWRMWNSMSGRAAYVATLCESLQDLTMLALEYQEFPVGSVVSGQGGGQTVVGSGSTGQAGTPLDMVLVNKMTAAFVEKAKEVSEWRICLLAWSMGNIVDGKLMSITEVNQGGTEVYLAIEQQTLDTLEELKQMFNAVAAMLGGDTHLVCPHALDAVKATKHSATKRPSSVASDILDDPDVYRRSRPKATHKILEDDMLYRLGK